MELQQPTAMAEAHRLYDNYGELAMLANLVFANVNKGKQKPLATQRHPAPARRNPGGTQPSPVPFHNPSADGTD